MPTLRRAFEGLKMRIKRLSKWVPRTWEWHNAHHVWSFYNLAKRCITDTGWPGESDRDNISAIVLPKNLPDLVLVLEERSYHYISRPLLGTSLVGGNYSRGGPYMAHRQEGQNHTLRFSFYSAPFA